MQTLHSTNTVCSTFNESITSGHIHQSLSLFLSIKSPFLWNNIITNLLQITNRKLSALRFVAFFFNLLKLVFCTTRINVYHDSFFPSTIILWNNLPATVVTCNSLQSFTCRGCTLITYDTIQHSACIVCLTVCSTLFQCVTLRVSPAHV